MAKQKFFFDRLRAWLREYFRHPLENLRQANPVQPKRLYNYFGYTVKLLPMSSDERKALKSWPDMALPPNILANMHALSAISRFYDENPVQSDIPARCNFCGIYRKSLPCPYFNILADGSTACEHGKYVIIKSPNDNK